MPDEVPGPDHDHDVGWGFGVLAVVLVLILLGWGWGSSGRGWGRDNQMAHMMPPAASSADGPATRAWTPHSR
jgi:hypothetical protein